MPPPLVGVVTVVVVGPLPDRMTLVNPLIVVVGVVVDPAIVEPLG